MNPPAHSDAPAAWGRHPWPKSRPRSPWDFSNGGGAATKTILRARLATRFATAREVRLRAVKFAASNLQSVAGIARRR